jgi:subtilisin family serine protease
MMKLLGPILILLGAALPTGSRAGTPIAFGPPKDRAWRPGEVLVAMPNAGDLLPGPAGSLRCERRGVSELLQHYGLTRIRNVGASPSASGPRLAVLASDRPDFDPRVTAAELQDRGAFRVAMPNYLLRLCITIPNDPYALPEQWYIQSPADADVDLPEAWDVERGDTSIVIGIADTGVDLGHPDLVDKIWTNPGEIPDNGVDDDGNGYVDDVHGWDFGDNDNDPNPEPLMDPDLGIDIAFHGTFVAGIAAASTNDGIGMAGAAWRCRIMPLKLSDAAGNITVESLAGAFLYAAQQRAAVLNLSLGQYAEPGLPELFQALVDHADSAGVVCVAAAGNDADSARFYPAACERVIAVGATDQGNLRTSFSNWGPWIDVSAPGTSMLSAINRNYTIDEVSQIFYMYLFGWDGENPYMYGDGTSFACPLVSGTCGLVRSHWAMSPGSARMQVVTTGDNLPFDLPIGTKLNAYRAVTIAAGVPGSGPATNVAFLAPGQPNPFRDRVSLRFSLASGGFASLHIVDVQGRTVCTLASGTFAAGPHRAEWDGRAADGRAVESGVYFATLRVGPWSATRRLAFVR